MSKIKSNFKKLLININIYGDVINDELPNNYTYKDNTDITSKFSYFYIPSQVLLSKITNLNYKDLLNKNYVSSLNIDSTTKKNAKLILDENIKFLIKIIFKKNNKFYVKCNEYIIKNYKINNNNKRNKFINMNSMTNNDIKQLIKKDNLLKIQEYNKNLLEIYNNDIMSKEYKRKLENYKLELLNRIDSKNLLEYAVRLIKNIKKDNKYYIIKYNLKIKYTKDKGIVISYPENEKNIEIILELSNIFTIKNNTYNYCKKSKKRIENIWVNICKKNNYKIDMKSKKNKKNNLLYLICNDKYGNTTYKNKSYDIKNKSYDIKNLSDNCKNRISISSIKSIKSNTRKRK